MAPAIVSRSRLVALALTFAAVLIAGAVRTAAQDVTEVTLKGAFILNFSRFTDWPPDALPSTSTLAACVVGDPAMKGAIERAVSGTDHRVNGRPVHVALLAATDAALTKCHVVYVSGLDRPRLNEVVQRLQGAPALTIGDDDAFMAAGGVIQMYIDRGKIHFRINTGAARRARLRLSSRMLALAEIVDEAPRVPAVAGPGVSPR